MLRPFESIRGGYAVCRRDASVLGAIGWIALTAFAYAGNVAQLPLFYGVEFLFGSVMLLTVLHYYGWLPALLSAAVASTYTLILWGHGYLFVVLTLEILVVGLLYRRYSHNLMLLDTVFWLLIGIPLTFVAHSTMLGIGGQTAFVLTLNRAINGILNALIAAVLVSIVQYYAPRLEPTDSRPAFDFAQVIVLIVVAFVLVPAIVILVVSAREEMARAREEIEARLSITAVSTRQAVNAWIGDKVQTLHSLAAFVQPDDSRQMGLLRAEMSLLRMSSPDFDALAVIDPIGRVVVGEPMSTARAILSGAPLAQWPYFTQVLTGMNGVASNALVKPSGDGHMVLLGVSIVQRDVLAGAVVGVLDVGRLHDMLDRLTSNWDITATVVDGNGIALVSTNDRIAPYSRVDDLLPAASERIGPNLYLRLPESAAQRPAQRRWYDAEFMTNDRTGQYSAWSIVLGAPTAPYEAAMTARYQSTLLLIILIITATILLSAVLSRRMLASLSKLTVVAENLSDKVTGQEDLDWPTSSINEIDTLIRCFRVTSEHLEESFQRVHEANQQLLIAKQEAEAASNTKTQFLANVSHDLRTPLNGILGYAQILSHDTSLDDRTKEAIAIIEKSGNHLLNLINDILDISRIEAQRLTLSHASFQLRPFLEDIADIVRLQAQRKGLDLVVEFDDSLPQSIAGDEKRIRQIALNLLTNAVKFTEEGTIWFRVDYESGMLGVEVQDTGIGIPADQIDEVFTPFRQLTKHVQSEEGTGLGLAIVQRLADAMGGTVAASSELGRGSLFRVTLAVAESDVSPDTPRPVSAIVGYKGPPITVLVVDDKWQNRSVARSMLEPLGFTVIEASDGAAGLDQLRTNEPDIVLMDLVMPVMDGFEAIRTIHADPLYARPKVVAVSASVAASIRDECVRVGFDDFLAKPLQQSDLLSSIRRHTGIVWTHRGDETDEQQIGRDRPAVDHPGRPSCHAPIDRVDLIERLVAAGNIKRILDEAARIQDEPGCEMFALQVIQMAQEFQINKLAEYLKRVRNGTARQDAPNE